MDRGGYDWSLLDGHDPTPGQPGTVDDLAGRATARADLATDAQARVDQAGLAVADSGWQGLTAEAYLSRFARLVPGAGRQADRCVEAAALLRQWAGRLADLQAETDRLYGWAAEARDQHERAQQDREVAERAHARAQHRRTMAGQAAIASAGAAAGEVTAADQEVRRAVARLTAARQEVERWAAERRALVDAARSLHDTHTEVALAFAGALDGVVGAPLALPPFGDSVLLAIAGETLPGEVDVDGDGRMDPEDWAVVLAGLYDPDRSPAALATIRAALLPALLAVAADPAQAGEVLAALGTGGLQGLLLGATAQAAPEAGEAGGLAEVGLHALLDLIASGSRSEVGDDVLAELADRHADLADTVDEVVLGLLVAAGVSGPAVTAALDAVVVPGDDGPALRAVLSGLVQRAGTAAEAADPWLLRVSRPAADTWWRNTLGLRPVTNARWHTDLPTTLTVINPKRAARLLRGLSTVGAALGYGEAVMHGIQRGREEGSWTVGALEGLEEVVGVTVSNAGGLAGSIPGAKLGGAALSWAGPIGIGVGTVGGGVLGWIGGSRLTREVYDFLTDDLPEAIGENEPSIPREPEPCGGPVSPASGARC